MNGDTVDADAFDRFEADGWARRVAGYDRFLSPVTSQVIATLLDAARVGPGQRALDLACGPGHVAAACAARGAAVVGVDVTHEMVALARERHPGITFRQADMQLLPFEDGSMDAVVGNFAILHVGRPERAAAQATRVLAPGGSLALSTWDVPERARLIGAITDAIAEAGAVPPENIPAGPPFFRFADEDEFARLLGEAGLVDVQVRTVAFHHRLAATDEWWDGLLGAAVRTRGLVLGQPEAVQARIRASFDRLAARYATADGLDVPISVKIASGVRPGA
jgi:SAM-dependent methyltransferase